GRKEGRTERLLEYRTGLDLDEMGMGGRGRKARRKREEFIGMIEGGASVEEIMAQVRKTEAGASRITAMTEEKFRAVMDPFLKVAEGGISKEEVGAISGEEAAGAAARARLRGAPDKRSPTSKLMETQVGHLKTMVQLTTQIARDAATNNLVQREITNILKQNKALVVPAGENSTK
ncbi:MAG: hypothetical protein ACXAEU_17150, partial [Candidatus Hodarchaeales archaeon]